MRIVFRTEGNHRQGMGDVWGSIALADEFARHQDETLFILSGGEEAITAIKGQGYRLRPADSLDAEQEVLRAFRPDAVIVNKLNNSSEYIKALKDFADLIVTIDDAGRGAKIADLNINVLYHIPGAVTDPQYVALRREFQEIHGQTKTIRTEVREFLIAQGGSDTYGFTPRIIRALERINCRPHCTVVTGAAFRHQAELEEAVGASTLDLTLVHNARNMAELMWSADLAITAGGLTMFELACVGTPSLVICGEPFEVETATRHEQAGAVVSLGFGGDLDYAQLPEAVDALAMNAEVRRQMSIRGKWLVDGRGCERIVRLIRERVEQAHGSRLRL